MAFIVAMTVTMPDQSHLDKPWRHPIAAWLGSYLERPDYSASESWRDDMRELVLMIERGAFDGVRTWVSEPTESHQE